MPTQIIGFKHCTMFWTLFVKGPKVPIEFVSENSIIEGLSELKLKDAKTIL